MQHIMSAETASFIQMHTVILLVVAIATGIIAIAIVLAMVSFLLRVTADQTAPTEGAAPTPADAPKEKLIDAVASPPSELGLLRARSRFYEQLGASIGKTSNRIRVEISNGGFLAKARVSEDEWKNQKLNDKTFAELQSLVPAEFEGIPVKFEILESKK